MRSVSSSQKVMSPTADLMPTGRPVSAARNSAQSSMLSVSENSAGRDGLGQSTPSGAPPAGGGGPGPPPGGGAGRRRSPRPPAGRQPPPPVGVGHPDPVYSRGQEGARP